MVNGIRCKQMHLYRRKSMKRTISILLAIIMIVSLAGCKGKEQGAGGTQNPTAEPTQNTAAPTAEVTPTEEASPTEEATPTEEPAPTEPAAPPEDLFLKDVFAEHGMKIGTCISPQMIARSSISKLITSNFSSLTAENAMKPDYIFNKKESQATGDLVVEFNDDAVQIMEFAKENGLSMRGHTLVWYSQTPNWIFKEGFENSGDDVDRDTMLARMESYIKQVFEQLEALGYIDLFYAYDVVNEAWMEDGKIRQNNWTKIIGDDYLWYAFYFADKYAPESIDLYYNDYNEQMKTQTLLNFVETLKDDTGRYLIDGVGFQAHLYTEDNLVQYFRTVDALAATGLKVQLTEIDIQLGKWQHPKEANDENFKVQGQFCYKLINGLLERVDSGSLKMDAITFWGVTDSMSWRSEYSPLLFDASLNPKYAYYAALQLKEFAGFDE